MAGADGGGGVCACGPTHVGSGWISSDPVWGGEMQ
jgi:hypothetical protein